MELALARHMTYREPSRREGIARLKALAGEGRVGPAARESWKQGLLWLNAAPSDAALYADYLASAGEDDEIRRRLDALRSGKAVAPSALDKVGAGYRALEREDVEGADAAFQWALKQTGKNVEALVGLAMVAMQREEFTRARKFLEEVRSLAPDRPELWEKSLVSARFWELLKDGDRLAGEGQPEKAEALYREAAGLSADEAIHAEMALGNLYFDQRRRDEAREMFGRVLERDPNHAYALRALVQLMLDQGQSEAAAVFNDRLARIDPLLAWKPERLQSEILRGRAAFERQVGYDDRALDLLQQARQADPQNAWALFDLANVYIELGRLAQARATTDELTALDPAAPAYRMLNVRLYIEEGRLAEALTAINATPSEKVTVEQRQLKREVETRMAAQSAIRRATLGGRIGPARRALSELQRNVQDSPRLLAVVAQAFADIGDYERALSGLRAALAQSAGDEPGIQLQLAAIYLRAERYDEFQLTLGMVIDNPSLSPRERRDLGNLRIAYAVRRTDRLREDGNIAGAYAYIQPLLKEYPDDARLMNALGRLLVQTAQYDEAGAVFARVLKGDPSNMEALQGAVEAAAKGGDDDRAKALLDAAFAQRPDDPRVYLIAGRVWRLLGKDARAMDALQKAKGLEENLERGKGDATDPAVEPPIYPDSEYEQILAGANARLAAEKTDRSADSTSLAAEIDREIEAIDANYRSVIGGEVQTRYRDGEPGLSRLLDVDTRLQASAPTGYVGRVQFIADGVFLEAGDAALDEAGTADRFGSYGAQGFVADDAKGQSAIGAALELGYAYKGYSVRAGSSPLGFPIKTITGGLVLSDQIRFFGFRLDGHRDMVRDSLLSYAGTRDPLSGKLWGGVTKNGGRLDLSFSGGPMIYYMYGGYDFLMGERVRDNHAVNAGLGLKWNVHSRANMEWTLGLSGNAMGYQHNLRFFTLGHGGYFSPQLFINAGAPVVWAGRYERLSYGIDGLVGLNWFREDAVDYYPDRPDLQSARDALALADFETPGQYDKRSTISFALNAGGFLAYRILPELEAGLRVHVYTAEEYTEFIGALNLTYIFGAQRKSGDTPLPPIPEE
ncbi:MAG: hypothetical protein C4523_02110 [Myxococcales bacterium]|nr:MAG: hypothetical protein C4523_02110 [Myxococcales bacterium]